MPNRPGSAEMSEADPTQAGPYTLTKLIATGAQSQVWTATGPDGDVVIKRARTPAHRAALKREAEILHGDTHPNLARLIASDSDHEWLALEHIRGTPIDQWAQLEEVEDVVLTFVQLLNAVAHLHGQGILHGDIKPSNVLIAPNRVLKLLDLGIATRAGETVEGFRGSLGYAAPELLKGSPPSVSTDLYGVGALLYTCVTGRPPFVATDPAALTYLPLVSLPPPPSAFRPAIPSQLNQLLLSLLSRNATLRLSQIDEIRERLEGSIGGNPAAPVLGMLNEREQLRQAVVGAADGETRVVVLYGPPGSGRRTLIAEAVEHARREGLAYLKGSEPRKTLAALRKSTRPHVIVMRGKAGRKLAQVIISEGLPCIFLLHTDRPIPALAQKGAIQVTPAPLKEVDAARIGRMYGCPQDQTEQWWRASLGLPSALLGRVRAWRRQKNGDPFDMNDLPPDARVIYAALRDAGKLTVAELAVQIEMDEHAVLDHCEVLFAEGVLSDEDDGESLRVLDA
jgi:predicted Ser/Thr protein kinase